MIITEFFSNLYTMKFSSTKFFFSLQQKELSKSNNKMTAMKEEFEKEKEDAINRKITEINNLKKNLEQSKADLEKQEVQTQAHKQVLDKTNMEMEALKVSRKSQS